MLHVGFSLGPDHSAVLDDVAKKQDLNQSEFKHRRKSRSRRGNEAEVFFAPEIRLLTSSATILEDTLGPSNGSNSLLTCKQFINKQSAMSVSPPSPGPRYQALLQLLRTAEALWNASRNFFARWDLSPSQFNVLNLLYNQSTGCTQIELSRSLIMHRSNVTGLVDRLEARGLVQRRDSAHDRRAYRVVLTTAGKKLVQQILPRYYAAAEQVWGVLPVSRAHQLVSELRGVCANAEKVAGDGLAD